MSYKFLDHTADIAVEVHADTIEDLFISAAAAWSEAVIEFNEEGQQEKRIYLSESTLEELLVSFLAELNYLLYSKRWMFNRIISIVLEPRQGTWNLNCLITGNELNNKEYTIKEEIKAVTFHQMLIQQLEGQYTTRIIFDI